MAGTDYERPRIEMPAAWRALPDTGVRSDVLWWKSFDDPMLDALIAAALTNNPDIETALASIDRARADLGAARAAMLPAAALQADVARTQDSNNVGLNRIANQVPGVSINRATTLYDATASASWGLDLFGGLHRQGEAARYEYEAAVATAAVSRVSIAAEVADTYIRLRTAQTRLDVAARLTALRTRLEALVRTRHSVGEASLLELEQARATSAAIRATLPQLRADIELHLNRIALLIGRMPQVERGALDRNGPVPIGKLSGLGMPGDLLRRRPDVIAAERRLAATHARIGATLASYYPSLSLTAAAGLISNAASNLFTQSSTFLQGGVGLRWRLFDFGRLDAEVAAARADERAALAIYRASILRAAEDVEAAAILYTARRERLSALAEERRAAANARKLAQRAWKAGETDLSEVIEGDRRSLEAEDAAIVAQSDASRAVVAAYRAVGG